MGYIDPGAFGLVSQMGYFLIFTVASVFLFVWRPVKDMLGKWHKPGDLEQPQAIRVPKRDEDPAELRSSESGGTPS